MRAHFYAWRALVVLLIGGFAATAVSAAEQDKPPVLNQRQLQAAIIDKLAELLVPQAGREAEGPPTPADVVRSVNSRARNATRNVPESTQVTAPQAAGWGSSLVDTASFPAVLGAAFENDLLKMQDSAFTVNLNAFAFATLANPRALAQQEFYNTPAHRIMRRFGGSLTLGGKGESFDRDGDGKAEPAQAADKLGDIVTWEAKIRVWGSRDRRDDDALARYLGAPVVNMAGASLGTVSEIADRVSRGVADFVANHIADLKLDAKGMAPEVAVTALLARPESAVELSALANDLALLDRTAEDAVRRLDGSAVWTVVAGATAQGREFGPNKWHIGLRGDLATGPIDHAINVDWNTVSGSGEAKDAKTWKAGYQASTLLLKGTPLTKEGLSLSWTLGAEYYRDVPAVTHDTIVRSSVKLVIPINETVKVPFSINYANHQDLLTDQQYVAGHIGLAFDFSGLGKK